MRVSVNGMSSNTHNLQIKLHNNMYSYIFFLQIAAEAENTDNAQEQKRQMGKRVRYGEIIQVQFTSLL